MAKITIALFAVALLLSAVWLTHLAATGIGVPYPDPTPEQAAYQRYHHAISDPILLSAVAAWLLAGFSFVACVGSWLFRAVRKTPCRSDAKLAGQTSPHAAVIEPFNLSGTPSK